MSTDRLTRAARVLRERAEAAPGGPWRYAEHGYYHTGPTEVRVMSNVRPEPMLVGDYDSYSGHAAIYAAMMHPGVALVLADWLDYTAKAANAKGRHISHAHRVADLILGAES